MNNYQSDSLTSLMPALVKAQSKLKVAEKKKRAGSGMAGSRTYKYADWGEIISASREPLLSQGLCVLQRLITKEDNSLILSTLLLHTSGEYIDSRLPLSLPPGYTPQQFGSCLTYYKRYAYMCLIGVVTDDESDDDAQEALKAYTKQPMAQIKATPIPKIAPSSREPEVAEESPYISKDQWKELERALEGSHPSLRQSIHKKYAILSLESLPKAEYEYVIDTARAWIRAEAKSKQSA